MKLFTHNMLTSKCIRGVIDGYPLAINARDIQILDVNFNSDFISRLIPKVNWTVLHKATASLSYPFDLPNNVPTDYENDEEFLKKAHHALLEIDVIGGDLTCPETGRKFPINDGVPNMLLNEDEI